MVKRTICIALTALCMLLGTHARGYVWQTDGSVICSWNTTDEVGLYTQAATYLRFYTRQVSDTDSRCADATGIMALNPNCTFYSVAPYSTAYKFISGYSALPVNYTGQMQSANGSLEHIAPYDYMAAQTVSTSTSATFTYNHLGCLLRIEMFVPEKKVFKSLTISSVDDSPCFISQATIDVSTNCVTATATQSTALLTMDNIEVPRGEKLIAYLMMPATNLAGRPLKVTALGTDGRAIVADIAGCQMKQGKIYPVTLTEADVRIVRVEEKKEDTPEVLSLRGTIGLEGEKKETADAQITAARCVLQDFVPDGTTTLKSVILGDANYDTEVDMVDAIMINGYYLRGRTAELDKKVCDVNGDGVVDVTDVIAIIGKYLNRQ